MRPHERRTVSPQGQSGFTLIELMVVVVVIGILATLAVISIRADPATRQLEEEARRVEALFRLVGEEATMQSRDIGLRVTLDAYEFLLFEPDMGTWVSADYDRLLRKRVLPDGLGISLHLQDLDTDLPEAAADQPMPQAVFFSSGDVTPFELILDSDAARAQIELRVNALGDTEREHVDYGL